MSAWFLGGKLYRERRVRRGRGYETWSTSPDRRQLIHKGRKP